MPLEFLEMTSRFGLDYLLPEDHPDDRLRRLAKGQRAALQIGDAFHTARDSIDKDRGLSNEGRQKAIQREALVSLKDLGKLMAGHLVQPAEQRIDRLEREVNAALKARLHQADAGEILLEQEIRRELHAIPDALDRTAAIMSAIEVGAERELIALLRAPAVRPILDAEQTEQARQKWAETHKRDEVRELGELKEARDAVFSVFEHVKADLRPHIVHGDVPEEFAAEVEPVEIGAGEGAGGAAAA